MTHVVKLFGDSIIAEQTEKGTYIVRKGENMVSPYEYSEIRQLTPKCWRLFRPDAKKHDLIFSNGAMQLGFDFAYAAEKMGRSRKKKSWIAVMLKNGTGVYDDSGNFVAFLPGLVNVAIADDRFLVAVLMAGSEPYVKVYTMWGEFLAEGFMSEALKKAKAKAEQAWA
jgi:hypothetical protein